MKLRYQDLFWIRKRYRFARAADRQGLVVQHPLDAVRLAYGQAGLDYFEHLRIRDFEREIADK